MHCHAAVAQLSSALREFAYGCVAAWPVIKHSVDSQRFLQTLQET